MIRLAKSWSNPRQFLIKFRSRLEPISLDRKSRQTTGKLLICKEVFGPSAVVILPRKDAFRTISGNPGLRSGVPLRKQALSARCKRNYIPLHYLSDRARGNKTIEYLLITLKSLDFAFSGGLFLSYVELPRVCDFGKET